MTEINFSNTTIPGEDIQEKVVEEENELKTWLVNYVGSKEGPENGQVTVGLIVETMAKEFPEFLLAVAEENWIRGYQQALIDSDVGKAAIKDVITGMDESKKTNE